MKFRILIAVCALVVGNAFAAPFVVIDHASSRNDMATMRALTAVNARHHGSADAFLVTDGFASIRPKLETMLLTGSIRIEEDASAVSRAAVRRRAADFAGPGALMADLAEGLAAGGDSLVVEWTDYDGDAVTRYEEFAAMLAGGRPYFEKVAEQVRRTVAGAADSFSIREDRTKCIRAFPRVDANGQVRALTVRNVSGGAVPPTRIAVGKAAPGKATWHVLGAKPVELDLISCGQADGVAVRLPELAGGGIGTLCFEPDELWRRAVTPPERYADFLRIVEKQKKTYEFDGFTVEYYDQANGPSVFQTLIVAVPKNLAGKLPAVVVPYYFPEAMLAFDPKTGKELPSYKEVAYMADLARRGYVTVSAQAFHLTYARKELPENDWDKWIHAATALTRDWPEWTGVGKLVFDTRLLIDLLAADSRVDPERIGIIGHSLGGKMAFYTGCLDSRIKAIVASDFGLGWQQTNWQDIWYWGDKLGDVVRSGFENADLLAATGGTPICIIAGKADDALTGEEVRRLAPYAKDPSRFLLVNHGTGHRPTPEATEVGYRFLDSVLKK